MKLRKYTEEDLKIAIKTSTSMRQVLQTLGVAPYGGNYQVLKKAITYFHLSTDHFTGQGWRKDKEFIPKRPLSNYLSNQYPIQSNKLKKRLLKEGLVTYKCSVCGLDVWLEKPIPLELDHIDGNNQNNSLDNLRLVCPNCHAFTPTYRGKNKNSG